jgi:hypothetical protein
MTARCACDEHYVCTSCEARISAAEDVRNGLDFDPSGSMADAAADDYYGGDW